MRKNIITPIIPFALYAIFYGALAHGETHCVAGAYGDSKTNIIVLTEKEWLPNSHFGYLTLQGRFGSTQDADKPFECSGDFLVSKTSAPSEITFKKIEFDRTDKSFASANTNLMGQLIERKDLSITDAPLLVMVHGSEREAAIGSSRSLLLASMGLRVFVYDKRGTGRSGGLYTQNFELLADDAVAAMQSARELAKGRYGRAGFFGTSQGGWVAPLAGNRANADYIAIGFGLIASPIEEDLDQMMLEAREYGLDKRDIKKLKQLSKATARVVNSHFATGFHQLEQFRKQISGQPWVSFIEGEYSGDMLRMSNEDLLRIGRPVFDNLELIWDYDAESVIQQVKVPLLWVLAQNDREAPMERTKNTLTKLSNQGVPIKVFVFPDTDHGMYEYVDRSDGSREFTRVAKGYFELIGSWVKDTALPKAHYMELNDFNKSQPEL